MSIESVTEDAWKAYTLTVYRTAERVFNELIKPFCKRRGLRFLAGNGEWWISSQNHSDWRQEDFLDDKEWQVIVSVLDMGIPGMPLNDLGSLMPSFENPERE